MHSSQHVGPKTTLFVRHNRKKRLLYSPSDSEMYDLILLCSDLSKGLDGIPIDMLILNALEGRFVSAIKTVRSDR